MSKLQYLTERGAKILFFYEKAFSNHKNPFPNRTNQLACAFRNASGVSDVISLNTR